MSRIDSFGRFEHRHTLSLSPLTWHLQLNITRVHVRLIPDRLTVMVHPVQLVQVCQGDKNIDGEEAVVLGNDDHRVTGPDDPSRCQCCRLCGGDPFRWTSNVTN